MKKRHIFATASLFLAAALAGPRPRLTPPPLTLPPLPTHPPDLLTLAATLAHQEATASPPVLPGNAATIQWGATPGARTPLSLLYLHGFTASPGEASPVFEEVARALGANAYFARWSGHGQGEAGLATASASQWLTDALSALAVASALGERVILVGTSTGGTLATLLAALCAASPSTLPVEVAALILLSPNFGLQNPLSRLLVGPWGRTLARLLVGPHVTSAPLSDAHAQRWTLRFSVESLIQVLLVVQHTLRAPLEHLRTPTLLLHHPHDPVVSVARMRATFRRFASPLNHMLDITSLCPDGDHHVITGHIRSPQRVTPTIQAVLSFLQRACGMSAHDPAHLTDR